MRKALRITLASLLAIILCIIGVSAHTGSQIGLIDSVGAKVGSENVGWIIDESAHTNGTAINYRFVTGEKQLSSSLKNLFRAGAALWSNVVNITEFSTSYNCIEYWEDPPYGYNAKFVNETTSNGHFGTWEIEVHPNIATYLSENELITAVFAHELGHAIGLCDLSLSQSSNKLMYAYGDKMTVRAPTSYDLWGARVITGQHTTHRWTPTLNNHTCTMCYGIRTHSVRNYTYSPTNASVHTITVCSVCNYTYTESHGAYYNQLLGRCSKCGYTGSIVLGIGDETE